MPRSAGSASVIERAPLLAEAARHVGHAAIRHRGTLGGSLAHADPAAELPAALVALGAELRPPRPPRRADDPGLGVLSRPDDDRAGAGRDPAGDPRARRRDRAGASPKSCAGRATLPWPAWWPSWAGRPGRRGAASSRGSWASAWATGPCASPRRRRSSRAQAVTRAPHRAGGRGRRRGVRSTG